MKRVRNWVSRRSLIPSLLTLAAGLSAAGAVAVFGGWGSVASDEPQGSTSAPFQSEQLFAFPGDWETIEPVVVRAVYPGQASWQFVTSEAHLGKEATLSGASCQGCHGNALQNESSVAGWSGPPPVNHREGTGCVACHGVIEQRIGDLGMSLVNHPVLEQDPIEGKRPYVDVSVQAAYDSEYVYLRFEWDSEEPGVRHDLYQWDGEAWRRPRSVRPGAEIPSYEDRLSLLIDDRDLRAYDGAAAGFGTVSCWLSCHTSMNQMPEMPARADVEGHPYLGETLGESEVGKYLLNTRTEFERAGGWDRTKAEEEIARLREAGEFLDMIMWRGSRGGPIGYADDFHILDARHSDEGRGAPRTVGAGEFMFDEEQTGFRVLSEQQLLTQPELYPLHENDAVAIPEGTEFEVGDLIPRRLLREPGGSRADVLANSRWADGRWTLELRRRLDTGHADDKALAPGRVYNIGVAVFDDHIANRRHHVSDAVSLGIGVPADVHAVSLDGQ